MACGVSSPLGLSSTPLICFALRCKFYTLSRGNWLFHFVSMYVLRRKVLVHMSCASGDATGISFVPSVWVDPACNLAT